VSRVICSTGKKVYASEALAEDALIEARIQFDYQAGRGPVAVYRCEACGHYHLTSQGPMSEKLKMYLASGQLDKQKQANYWAHKLKGK
jgi:ABC-type ATPase with predicted acetyltransferase domain